MIDILLPFHGDPQLLREAVESVLNQASSEWRLVVVDDCYPDRSTGDWLSSLKDSRIEYHRNETNLGPNLNYQRAVTLSSAKHIVVMGADDRLLTNYVSSMESALEDFPSAAVVSPAVRVIDAAGRPLSTLTDRIKRQMTPQIGAAPRSLGTDRLLRSLLMGNWTYFPSLCWRRDVVLSIGFRPGFNVVQDLGLLVDVIRTGGDMVLTPDVAFEYRRHADSDSALKAVRGSRFEEEARFFSVIAAELDAEGRHTAARAARIHLLSRLHAMSLIPGAAKARDRAALRRLARHAVSVG